MSEAGTKKSDIGVRTMSAMVMIALVGTVLWVGGWWWRVFVLMVFLGTFFEWAKLVKAFAATVHSRAIWFLSGLLYLAVAGYALIELREMSGIQENIENGLVPLWPYPRLSNLWPALMVILVVVAVDIGAYLTGRAFGGPKIAPAISPSKTWSGLIGGMLAAGLTLNALAWINYRYLALCDFKGSGLCDVSLSEAALSVLIGSIVAVIAQSGDFLESWMKRKAGVKDSGNLIPGHGGLFDRVDGHLAVLFALGCLLFFAAQLA